MLIFFIVKVAAIAIAGIANGYMDTLQFHYGRSIFPQEDTEDEYFGRGYGFWNPGVSWKNKYRDYPTDKRPKFFLSTTLLVMFTDGWHFTQFIMNTCIIVAAMPPVSAAVLFGVNVPVYGMWFLWFAGLRLTMGVWEWFFYNRVLLDKS